MHSVVWHRTWHEPMARPLTEIVHGYMLLFGVFFFLLLCSLLPRIRSLAQGFLYAELQQNSH